MKSPLKEPKLIDPQKWVDAYGDYLYNFALARLRDNTLAEDAVQETFLAALKARGNFSGKSSERTWLIAILKNKIADTLRKIYREQKIENIDTLGYETEEPFQNESGKYPGHWNLAAAPADWGNNPAVYLDQKEFWTAFQNCVAVLPRKLAAAFTLHEIERMKGRDICQELGITQSNLWVMLHRSRMQLRRCLEINWIGQITTKGEK